VRWRPAAGAAEAEAAAAAAAAAKREKERARADQAAAAEAKAAAARAAEEARAQAEAVAEAEAKREAKEAARKAAAAAAREAAAEDARNATAQAAKAAKAAAVAEARAAAAEAARAAQAEAEAEAAAEAKGPDPRNTASTTNRPRSRTEPVRPPSQSSQPADDGLSEFQRAFQRRSMRKSQKLESLVGSPPSGASESESESSTDSPAVVKTNSPMSAAKRASMWETRSTTGTPSTPDSTGLPATPDSSSGGNPAQPRRSTGWRAPVTEKCVCCNKTVYAMEKVLADGVTYCKNGFRCTNCKKALRLGNYASMERTLFCKPCFKKMFKEHGNYSEGFGKEQHKMKWLKKEDGSNDVSSV